MPLSELARTQCVRVALQLAIEIAELPAEFVRTITTLKADMEAIKEAIEHGATIPGVVMTNGGTSLTVRRK